MYFIVLNVHPAGTGGASGLGLSLAKQLVKGGVSVTLLDRQNPSAAVGSLKAEASPSASVQGLTADVSNYTEVCMIWPRFYQVSTHTL
jgi:NAD(P)-dependent dehydrogenase (short-subunit alcohol dehydrogenase family)